MKRDSAVVAARLSEQEVAGSTFWLVLTFAFLENIVESTFIYAESSATAYSSCGNS